MPAISTPNPFHLPIEPDDPVFRSTVLEARFSRYWERREAAWKKARIEIDRKGYVDLFIGQRGLCGICGIHWRRTGKNLAADHSHASGQVRGLLCSRDNYDLGSREMAVSCGARVRFTPAQFAYLRRSQAGVELLSLSRW